MKNSLKIFYCLSLLLAGIIPGNLFAQKVDLKTEKKAIVEHFRFAGNHREESMWSALYGAKSGKIYIGLCTHADAAHFYEFDPATQAMRHIVDLTELHNERGEGISTNGKIHVRMGEDKEGNIYFATLALTISNDQVIYYAPTGSSSFDYVGNSWDVTDEADFQAKLAGGHFPPVTYLVSYDLKTKERKSNGMIVTREGNMVFGLGGACTGAKDGKIYFVGAIEEKDKKFVVGEVCNRWPFSMGLVAYDPNKK